ncbi:MAG TPA: murein biosynthesis integral membrane protein MurJ [Mycobacteriales bacterium]
MTAAGSSGAALVRGGGTMALGTIVSRATGLIRTLVLGAALGVNALSDAYNVSNTVPNVVYDLLLGGVLTSVVVPILVRAAREDDDGGEGFLSTLFTVVTVGMIIVSIVGVVAAPLLMRLYLHPGVSAQERQLAVTLTRFFIPQLTFYALTALFSAVLTIRGRFGAVGLAPALNNVVVITVTAVFFLTPRGPRLTTAHLDNGQTLLLGLGTTAGVVAMTLALLPSLARAGVHLRWRFRLADPRLRAAARLATWVLVYAAANQIGFLIITNLATAQGGGASAYAYAFLLFQLPYAIVTVSVISAVMPGLSSAALDDDGGAVRSQLSRALRLSFVLLIPAAFGLLVLAGPLTDAAFAHGLTTTAKAAVLGRALTVFAIGLPAFSAYQLLLRVFYARHDSRTPAVINIWANAVNIVADVVLVVLLPADQRIPGLAGGFVLSYVVGTALAVRRLRATLGGIDGFRVTRLVVRVSLAGVLGAAVAGAIAAEIEGGLGHGTAGAVLATFAGAVVGGVVYVWAARRMRVSEVTGLLAMLRR